MFSQKPWSIFYHPRENTQISISVMLDLVSRLSYFALIDLTCANVLATPFAFSQNSSFYIFKSDLPVSSNDTNLHTWQAFQSIANSILNGTLGDIVPLQQTNISTHNIWTGETCDNTLQLDSNNTKNMTELFLSDFKNMIKNDTFYEAATQCWDFSLKRIGLVLAVIVIVALLSIFLHYLVNAACNICHRKNYEPIREGGPDNQRLGL